MHAFLVQISFPLLPIPPTPLSTPPPLHLLLRLTVPLLPFLMPSISPPFFSSSFVFPLPPPPLSLILPPPSHVLTFTSRIARGKVEDWPGVAGTGAGRITTGKGGSGAVRFEFVEKPGEGESFYWDWGGWLDRFGFEGEFDFDVEIFARGGIEGSNNFGEPYFAGCRDGKVGTLGGEELRSRHGG